MFLLVVAVVVVVDFLFCVFFVVFFWLLLLFCFSLGYSVQSHLGFTGVFFFFFAVTINCGKAECWGPVTQCEKLRSESQVLTP